MILDPTPDRRTVLKAIGAAGVFGGVDTVAARPQPGELRLVGEQAVPRSREVVSQDGYTYHATVTGMAIVDWRDPQQPSIVADVEASPPDEIGGDDYGEIGEVLDVKVDGDVAAMAHNSGSGITIVDVSDPSNPAELAFHNNLDAANVHNCFIEGEYAYMTVSDTIGTPFDQAGVEIVDISDPSDPEFVELWRLRDAFPDFASAGVNPNHDIYVQDGLAYNAFWDAGIVVLDVSDPADPSVVAQFGEAPGADEPMGDSFPRERYATNPGNAHYVQPSPDGDYTYVGDETFPNAVEAPENDTFGGIRIFDTSDWSAVEQVGFIEPPDEGGFRTSHNFDVTANRLYTSWYQGGIRVHDVTDPTEPAERSSYQDDAMYFWAAVHERGFVLGGDIGGGLSIFQDDDSHTDSPEIDEDETPESPAIGRSIDE